MLNAYGQKNIAGHKPARTNKMIAMAFAFALVAAPVFALTNNAKAVNHNPQQTIAAAVNITDAPNAAINQNANANMPAPNVFLALTNPVNENNNGTSANVTTATGNPAGNTGNTATKNIALGNNVNVTVNNNFGAVNNAPNVATNNANVNGGQSQTMLVNTTGSPGVYQNCT